MKDYWQKIIFKRTNTKWDLYRGFAFSTKRKILKTKEIDNLTSDDEDKTRLDVPRHKLTQLTSIQN